MGFQCSDMTRISVIIVNYGTADLAAEAVQTVLARDHGGRVVDIHLVDNGSPGDDAGMLGRVHAERGWGERVTLHLEHENHGFGRGNNVVLNTLAKAAARPDYVFFLNPDARLANEAVDIMATFLDDHPGAVAAGAAVLRPDGTRVSAAFRFPSPASEFVGMASFGILNRLLPGREVALPPETERRPVDWVSGAAFMVRFPVLLEAGFFDPDFFLYFEEAELMWRLHGTGQSVWYVPEAKVEHVAGAATGMRGGKHVSRAKPGYWYDSWRLYHVKTRGVGAARMAAVLSVAGAAINLALSMVRRKASNVPVRFFRDFGRNVLRPLFLGDPLLARPDGKTIKVSAR